jgi:C4-dicarboxylate-specific signal transduction histidine kinase
VSLGRHHIKLVRDYAVVPVVQLDKHKMLQILVNLIKNATDALRQSDRNDKVLSAIIAAEGANQVRIAIRDNGLGIDPENLTRIFAHGFTTKKEGHGFGLHSSAVAAHEMGGSLNVASDGLGQGATFTLTLPVAPVTRNGVCKITS